MDWASLFKRPERSRKPLRELDLADNMVSWRPDRIEILDDVYPIMYINVARERIVEDSIMQSGDIRFEYRKLNGEWRDGIASRRADARGWRWNVRFF